MLNYASAIKCRVFDIVDKTILCKKKERLQNEIASRQLQIKQKYTLSVPDELDLHHTEH